MPPTLTTGDRAVRKPRIVYVHGDGVLHWDWGWVVRARGELQAAGFPTFFELLPDSIEARAKYWMPFLEQHARVGPDDVLLGWSCGAVAAMRFAESHRVRGLVLVAPYYTDLGLESVRRSGWVCEPWHWSRIRANAGSVVVFHSDADPYISQDEFAAVARSLEAPVKVITGAGHFGDMDDFPELLAHVRQAYG
jgi:predicted alpha/beta hydrolase family esterase